MKNTMRVAAIPAAIVLLLASPGYADQGRSGYSSSYGGSPSQSAMDAFSKADTDHDGKLSRSEFEAIKMSQMGKMSSYTSDTSWLANKRVSDVEGMDVLNQQGKKIGDVDKLVLSPRDNKVYAVISVGGFLGIGDTEITMPLDQLALHGDKKLMAPTSATKAEIKERGEHPEITYWKLEGNQLLTAAGTVSTFSGLAQSFDSLDADRNGYIGRAEADQFPELTEGWSSADTSRDGRIDRSEFSAFEATSLREMKKKPDEMQQKPGEMQQRMY